MCIYLVVEMNFFGIIVRRSIN